MFCTVKIIGKLGCNLYYCSLLYCNFVSSVHILRILITFELLKFRMYSMVFLSFYYCRINQIYITFVYSQSEGNAESCHSAEASIRDGIRLIYITLFLQCLCYANSAVNPVRTVKNYKTISTIIFVFHRFCTLCPVAISKRIAFWHADGLVKKTEVLLFKRGRKIHK